MAMAISKWVLLFLVVSIAAGLSGVANRSSVFADVTGALFDALLILFVVLLVLGFTVYRPGWPFNSGNVCGWLQGERSRQATVGSVRTSCRRAVIASYRLLARLRHASGRRERPGNGVQDRKIPLARSKWREWPASHGVLRWLTIPAAHGLENWSNCHGFLKCEVASWHVWDMPAADENVRAMGCKTGKFPLHGQNDANDPHPTVSCVG